MRRTTATAAAPLLLPPALLLLAVACGGSGAPEGSGSPDTGDPAAAAAAAAADGAPWFVEEAATRGLDFRHDSGHDERNLFPEIVAGGAALFDMDGDGDLDAYLVQSGSLRAPGSGRGRNRLFANDGKGRFADVTEGSGAGDLGYGMGVTTGDYDGDGDTDLYVTNFGPDVLLRNDGGGKFTDVTRSAGIDNPSWGTSATFLDYDRDGDLDLYVTNYVNWSIENEQDCYNNAGMLDYCLPTNYNAPAMDKLFRNEGGGRFRDVSEAVGLQLAFGNGLGVVANDFDGDGWIDVFVANDTMRNELWMNRGGTEFRNESLLRGCALDEHGQTKAGMGVTSEDIDDDGDTDLLVVNLKGQTDSYYRNDGGIFVDQTGRVGLGTGSRFHTRFGVGFVDFDNDGLFDLFEANGRVIRNVEAGGADPFAEENILFRLGGDGRFVEVAPQGGVAPPLVETSRAAAFGDVDGDGGVDVLVVNKDAPAHLLMNRVPGRGNHAFFRLVGPNGGDQLGARLTARVGDATKTRFARAGYSYCAGNDPRVHLGLGAERIARDVRVTWVDGTVESFGDLAAGAVHSLRKGAGTATGS